MTVVVMPDGTHVEMTDKPAPPAAPNEPQPGDEGYADLPYERRREIDLASMKQFGSHALESFRKSLGGIADVAEHPVEAAKAIPGAVSKGVGAATKALSQPKVTVKQFLDYIRNFNSGQAGDIAGAGAVGAGAGKALGALGDLVGPSVKALLPKKAPVNPTVKRLAKEGVVMPPGVRGGKAASGIEQQLGKIPLAGEAVKAARSKSIEQWNTARLNEALKDARANPVPKNRTNPRDQLFHAKTEFTRRYDEVKSQMAADFNQGGAQSLNSRISQIRALTQTGVTGGTVDASTAATINEALDKMVTRFGTSGKASGDTLKALDEELRVQSEKLRRSDKNQDRLAGLTIDQARNELKLVRDHQNPKFAQELAGIDKGYRKYKDAAKAANLSTKGGGTYTPAQKLRAVYQRDKSKDKGDFSTGKAHGQREAQEAEDVLGNQVADSGTPTGLATLSALIHKPQLLALLPVSAGMHVMYSQPVLRFLQNRALKTGAKAGPSKLPYAAGAGATQFQEQPQQ